MKITLKIEEMMCPHCEARVKQCLEETGGVSEAAVSYKTGTAEVFADDTVSYEILKNKVIEQGYKVID